MGCGCAKKISRTRRGSSSRRASKNTVIRKKRLSKLVSIPGAVQKKKVVKKTKE